MTRPRRAGERPFREGATDSGDGVARDVVANPLKNAVSRCKKPRSITPGVCIESGLDWLSAVHALASPAAGPRGLGVRIKGQSVGPARDQPEKVTQAPPNIRVDHAGAVGIDQQLFGCPGDALNCSATLGDITESFSGAVETRFQFLDLLLHALVDGGRNQLSDLLLRSIPH